MTSDEIMNMPAGREMDELIAVHVLRITIDKTRCPYCGAEMWVGKERSRCSDCNEWRYSPYKQYSDDIAAAWDVVEEIKDKTFGIYWKDRPDIEDWCIVLNAVDSYSGAEAVYGETFPLAICRAALLVVSNG